MKNVKKEYDSIKKMIKASVGLVIDSIQTEEEEEKIQKKQQKIVSLTQIVNTVIHHLGCYSCFFRRPECQKLFFSSQTL